MKAFVVDSVGNDTAPLTTEVARTLSTSRRSVYSASVFPSGTVILLTLAAFPVRVESGDCPSRTEVGQALASLLPGISDATGQDLVRIETSPGQLRIALFDAENAVVAERTLDGTGTCSELARLAAIVIASWESDVHPEFVRPHTPLPTTSAPTAPPPTAAPTAPPTISAPRPTAAPGTQPASASYDVALGVSLEQADKIALGGTLGGSWFPHGKALGLAFATTGETTRTLDLGAHQARWRRWTGSLELAWRWGRKRLVADLHGGLRLGWLVTEGTDFSENHSNSSLSLAGTAGIRAAWWRWPRLALWADLRGFCFTRAESVFSPSGGEARIPRWGAVASIGAAWGKGPISP